MPYPVQLITYLFPIRYFLVILRGVVLKGVDITILYKEALILLIFALIMITISTLRFKKKIGWSMYFLDTLLHSSYTLDGFMENSTRPNVRLMTTFPAVIPASFRQVIFCPLLIKIWGIEGEVIVFYCKHSTTKEMGYHCPSPPLSSYPILKSQSLSFLNPKP